MSKNKDNGNEPKLVIKKTGLLLCEGKDEVNFFGAWLEELGLSDVQVIDYEGKDKLGKFLATVYTIPGFYHVCRIGITRDADDDAEAAMRSVQGFIEHAPEPIHGLAPTFYILPGEGKQGALEALWLASLSNQPYAECVEGFFTCIEAKGWKPSQTFAKNDKAKAQIWIATKDIPNERFGIAASFGRKVTDNPSKKECWVDFEHPAFDLLKQFLLTTFAPVEALPPQS
jgi:hypothetical protein